MQLLSTVEIQNEKNTTSSKPQNNSKKISVVIDGWHIRKLLTPNLRIRGVEYEGELIGSWFTVLKREIQERIVKDASWLFEAVAWDGYYDKDTRYKSHFELLEKLTQDRLNLITSKLVETTNTQCLFGEVTWKFIPLKFQKTRNRSNLKDKEQDLSLCSYPYQSGVDARIAASLFKAALEGWTDICLVTSDSDYTLAISVIKKHFDVRVHLFTYSQVKEELKLAVDTFVIGKL